MTTPDAGDEADTAAGTSDDAADDAGASDNAGDDTGDDAGASDDVGDDTGGIDDASVDAGPGGRRGDPHGTDSAEVRDAEDGSPAERDVGADAGADVGTESADSQENEPDVAASVDPSALTGPERRLNPRIRYVWVAQSVILAAILGAVGGVLGLAVDYGPLVGIAVFAVVATLGVAHSVLRFRSWRYQVRDDSLYLERGVFTHVKTVVPYVRIQHVDASRGPLERLLGLASSVVYTAGSRGADVTIPGLTPERSEELQSRLKQLAIAAEGDDAV